MVNKQDSFDFTPYTRGGSWPPVPPKGRMPLEQRAKIFMPFDALGGFMKAIRAKEREIDAANTHQKPLS